jgi:hypothetical protein
LDLKDIPCDWREVSRKEGTSKRKKPIIRKEGGIITGKSRTRKRGRANSNGYEVMITIRIRSKGGRERVSRICGGKKNMIETRTGVMAWRGVGEIRCG